MANDATKSNNEAATIIELADELELWHTPGEDAYCTLPDGDSIAHYPISKLRGYLRRRLWNQSKKAPSSGAMDTAMETLKAKALFGPECHPVAVRVGYAEPQTIYLDLANEAHEVVEIGPLGWRVIPAHQCEVRFRRTATMRALPTPERGGSLKELRPFVNVKDDDDFALVCGYLVGALRYTHPYAILGLQGEHGCTKTTLARLLRSLIDPAEPMLRSMPRNREDVAIATSTSWMIGFDNVSNLQPWLSDTLCQVASGLGFATRRLYTNDEEHVISASRPILINGIGSIVDRPDLLDRAIILTLPVLLKVKSEREFWAAWEKARPWVLGGLLDAVVVALRNEQHTHIEHPPRMSDLAIWVVASEEALPFEPGTFLAAYRKNQADGNAIALEASPVANALLAMADETRRLGRETIFEGTWPDLLATLTNHVDERVAKSKEWPTSSRKLSSDLDRLGPNLRAVGVRFDRLERDPGSSRDKLLRVWLYQHPTCAQIRDDPDRPDCPDHPAGTQNPTPTSASPESWREERGYQ